MNKMAEKLLEIKDLSIHFQTKDGEVPAVCGASLSVYKGEILALAGGSGSGKSTLCLQIIHLLRGNADILSGSIVLDGRSIESLAEKEMQKIRGKEISMIFQEPVETLDPTLTIGRQLTEIIRIHEKSISKSERKEKALKLLSEAGLENPDFCFRAYPWQLSGGMCQRCAIAASLSSSPRLLLADEPTSALDVTIQAEILKLLRKLRDEKRMSILFVTHDLGAAAQIADRIAIMKDGKIIETGTCMEIFSHPKETYTRSLIDSLPYTHLKGKEP